MSPRQLKALRIWIMVLLTLLFVQYEFGMAVNFANPPSLPAFNITDGNAFNDALNKAGGLAQPHSILGGLVWLAAVVIFVLSLRTGIRSARAFGSLTLLAISLAGAAGSFFVSSGFNNETASLIMATSFVLSFSFAFLELYFLKGTPT